MNTDINIGCPTHSYFTQNPELFLRGHGCKKCGNSKKGQYKKLSTGEFIEKSKLVQETVFDYSKCKYNSYYEKVILGCEYHGFFEQRADIHLRGNGCPKCTKYGFDPMSPAILYYFLDTYTGLYKIGVTNTTLKKRFLGKRYVKRIKVISIEYFNSGRLAQLKELYLHTKYKEYRMFNKDWDKSDKNGSTEFFNMDILKLGNLMLPAPKDTNAPG